MKRLLILVTLALFAICFVNGSQGEPVDLEEAAALADLNRVVDDNLQERLAMLELGAELSAGMSGR